MEDDVQKMMALKKAYADIILNTAKEAATRIMVSERKSLRFQQDLCSAKDESLRMLVRLKEMMDSKITEAEITSSRQRRMIDELESQLHEAEQIIIDLRFELKQVQDELKKVKKNQMPSSNGISNKEDVSSDAKRPSPSSDSQMNNSKYDKPDLDSVIITSKKPEQFRNGCTQRIHALETNLLDGKLPHVHVNDQISPIMNESVIREDEKGEEGCTLPSPKAESLDIMKKPTQSEDVKQLNSRPHTKPPIKVIRRRKRKIRYGKAKRTSRKSCPDQIVKPSQPSSLVLQCETQLNAVSDKVIPIGACTVPSLKVDNVDLTKNPTIFEENLQHDSNGCEDQAIKSIPSGYRKRLRKYRGTIATSLRSPPCQLAETCPPSSVLSRCKTFSSSLNGNVKSAEDLLEVIENREKSKEGLAVNASESVQYATDELMIDPFMSDKLQGDSSKRFPQCTTNLEVVDVPLTKPNSKDTKAVEANNGASSQADSDRLLKYTFHRKRRKDSLSNPVETTSLENSSMKRRAVEKQNADPEPQASSLIDESSRDSRRLVQVARQLISLSGKRWW